MKKYLRMQKIFKFEVSSKMVKMIKRCDFGAIRIESKPYGNATMTPINVNKFEKRRVVKGLALDLANTYAPLGV